VVVDDTRNGGTGYASQLGDFLQCRGHQLLLGALSQKPFKNSHLLGQKGGFDPVSWERSQTQYTTNQEVCQGVDQNFYNWWAESKVFRRDLLIYGKRPDLAQNIKTLWRT
jgi:hypothetical protein